VNPQFFATLVRRRKQYFNSNVGPNRRAPGASNESSVKCNIAGKAAFRMLATVTPVKDHRKAQFVSHGCPALRVGIDGWHRAELHSEIRLDALKLLRKTAIV